MKLKLVKKIVNNPETTSFLFAPEGDLYFKPGQFLRYHIPSLSPDERGENRFFSIAAAPFERVIRLTTKLVSNGSTFKQDLNKLNIGDSVEAFGPSGSFTLEDAEKNYVFIAGGIGITPFRSILLNLDQSGEPLNITLLYANRSKDIIFKDELETLAKKHPEFKIYYIISDESVAQTQITENVKLLPGKIDKNLLASLLFSAHSLLFYISGPEPMVQSFTKMLTGIGIPKENIKRDDFPGYENY